MVDSDKPEQAPEDLPADGGASISAKGRRSLSKSRRELTEEELTQSGVRLMLLDEVDRLDIEVRRCQAYEERYHLADKKVAVLEKQREKDIAVDVVHAVCVGLGVGFLMLAPTLTGQKIFAAGVGLVLTVAGIVVKVRRQ